MLKVVQLNNVLMVPEFNFVESKCTVMLVNDDVVGTDIVVMMVEVVAATMVAVTKV